MPAEITLSTGERVIDRTRDALMVMQFLGTARSERVTGAAGQPLPTGWVEIMTNDGPIYVDPDHVVSVRDYVDMPRGEETRGSLS